MPFTTDWSSAPKDAAIDADLVELGFELNDKGQFVDKDGNYYAYFVSDNERTNQVRDEALRERARGAVKYQLLAYDVQEVFLTGSGGIVIKERPISEPHVSILSTKPSIMKNRKDVVIVIPDLNSDLGLTSYRELFGEGGMDVGSVLGLAKKLQSTSLAGDGTPIGDNKPAVSSAADPNRPGDAPLWPDRLPGLIVLNPGELLYSHDLKKNMSVNVWNARSKENLTSAQRPMSDQDNRVPGHRNAREHVKTVLADVVTQLTKWNSDIYLVCVTDGADAFMDFVDAKVPGPLGADLKIFTGRNVKGIAFVNPTHDKYKDHHKLINLKMHFLGRSWVRSDEPVDTKIDGPTPCATMAPHFEDVPQTWVTDTFRRSKHNTERAIRLPVLEDTSAEYAAKCARPSIELQATSTQSGLPNTTQKSASLVDLENRTKMRQQQTDAEKRIKNRLGLTVKTDFERPNFNALTPEGARYALNNPLGVRSPSDGASGASLTDRTAEQERRFAEWQNQDPNSTTYLFQHGQMSGEFRDFATGERGPLYAETHSPQESRGAARLRAVREAQAAGEDWRMHVPGSPNLPYLHGNLSGETLFDSVTAEPGPLRESAGAAHLRAMRDAQAAESAGAAQLRAMRDAQAAESEDSSDGGVALGRGGADDSASVHNNLAMPTASGPDLQAAVERLEAGLASYTSSVYSRSVNSSPSRYSQSHSSDVGSSRDKAKDKSRGKAPATAPVSRFSDTSSDELPQSANQYPITIGYTSGLASFQMAGQSTQEVAVESDSPSEYSSAVGEQSNSEDSKNVGLTMKKYVYPSYADARAVAGVANEASRPRRTSALTQMIAAASPSVFATQPAPRFHFTDLSNLLASTPSSQSPVDEDEAVTRTLEGMNIPLMEESEEAYPDTAEMETVSGGGADAPLDCFWAHLVEEVVEWFVVMSYKS